MPRDTTTDAWMNVPLDHGRPWDRADAGKTYAHVFTVWTILALAIFALTVSFWKGRSDLRLSTAKDTALSAPSGSQPRPSPPRVMSRSEALDVQRTTRVTKCTSTIGASTTFSDGPCPPGSRKEELLVRPNANLADGMSAAQRTNSIEDSRARAQSTAEHEIRAAVRSSTGNEECAQLNAVIAALDAVARQPLPGAEQDRVRDQRRRARDRQFALSCS